MRRCVFGYSNGNIYLISFIRNFDEEVPHCALKKALYLQFVQPESSMCFVSDKNVLVSSSLSSVDSFLQLESPTSDETAVTF